MKIGEVARFVFSKNAGPYLITFDIGFQDEESYVHACSSRALTREALARLLQVPDADITSVHTFDPGHIFKFTMRRAHCAGDFGDRSVFGSQMWPLLLDVELDGDMSQQDDVLARPEPPVAPHPTRSPRRSS